MINLSIRWCVLIRSVRLWFDLDFYLWKEEKKQSLWKHISYILNTYIIKIWFQFIFSLLKNVKWLEWMASQCHDGFIWCDAAAKFRAISREQDAFSKCHLPFNWDQLAWKKKPSKRKSPLKHYPMIRLSVRFVREHGSKVFDCIQLRTFKHDFHVSLSFGII